MEEKATKSERVPPDWRPDVSSFHKDSGVSSSSSTLSSVTRRIGAQYPTSLVLSFLPGTSGSEVPRPKTEGTPSVPETRTRVEPQCPNEVGDHSPTVAGSFTRH